jgi:enamine deaminase RidA (YjgF/YER057c/UK114 family)
MGRTIANYSGATTRRAPRSTLEERSTRSDERNVRMRRMTIRHTVLEPDGLTRPAPYAHVVVAQPGRLIFCAGQVAEDERGTIVGAGDMRAQTAQALRNLGRALAAANATFDDLVKLTWFVTNVARIQELRDARVEVLGERRVASTLVEVTKLYRPELLVEVEAIAVGG